MPTFTLDTDKTFDDYMMVMSSQETDDDNEVRMGSYYGDASAWAVLKFTASGAWGIDDVGSGNADLVVKTKTGTLGGSHSFVAIVRVASTDPTPSTTGVGSTGWSSTPVEVTITSVTDEVYTLDLSSLMAAALPASPGTTTDNLYIAISVKDSTSSGYDATVDLYAKPHADAATFSGSGIDPTNPTGAEYLHNYRDFTGDLKNAYFYVTEQDGSTDGKVNLLHAQPRALFSIPSNQTGMTINTNNELNFTKALDRFNLFTASSGPEFQVNEAGLYIFKARVRWITSAGVTGYAYLKPRNVATGLYDWGYIRKDEINEVGAQRMSFEPIEIWLESSDEIAFDVYYEDSDVSGVWGEDFATDKTLSSIMLVDRIC